MSDGQDEAHVGKCEKHVKFLLENLKRRDNFKYVVFFPPSIHK
jgi:hypothetical protein